MNYTTAGFCNDGVSLEKQQQVKTIIEAFDFEKVSKVMKSLDWRWHGDTESPSYGKLVNVATEMLLNVYTEAVRAYNRPVIEMSSGGFSAVARRFDSEIYLELSFVVSSLDIRELID